MMPGGRQRARRANPNTRATTSAWAVLAYSIHLGLTGETGAPGKNPYSFELRRSSIDVNRHTKLA
jgi:hypothetical protein